MAVTGIIAEFNPLHTGHQRLIDSVKKQGDTLICAISGNFVQRGDTALIPKQKRAQAALLAGADVVVELPVLWSMSTAQNFALGGVSQLYHLGCERIVFGSECGDIAKLEKTADLLVSDRFAAGVSAEVARGGPFAAARQAVAVSLGADAAVLSSPNDNLGIEYILAARRLGLPMTFDCIRREGAPHDAAVPSGETPSSSFLRDLIRKGDIGRAERYMPIPLRGTIDPDHVSDLARLDRAILASLRVKTQQQLAALPDVSEGIENKLLFACRTATCFADLCESVKTKRYSMARIRRLVLSAFLELDHRFFMTPPPYVRVLGLSEAGAAHLKTLSSFLPVVTNVSQIKELDSGANAVFDIECRATDLYALSFAQPKPCGAEYTMKFLRSGK